MKLFGLIEDEGNETSVTMKKQSVSLNVRKFGTPLRSNVDRRSQRFEKSSTKKKVKVKRTPPPPHSTKSTTKDSKKHNNKNESSGEFLLPSNGKEKTIIFLPGAVGLQLEPVNDIPRYGCRVLRFIDGGPINPGQARQCGKIKPGDLVVKVEAEGASMVATTYEEIVSLLKLTHNKRIMTVLSVWDSISKSKSKYARKTNMPDGFIPTTRRMSNSLSIKKRDKEMLLSPPPISQQRLNISGIQNTPVENDLIYLPPFQNLLNFSSQEECNELSPIKNRALLAARSEAPIIIPLKADNSNLSSSKSIEDSNRRSPSHSQTPDESSEKSMTGSSSQSFADQFLLFDGGFTGAFQPEYSQNSVYSATSSIESRRSSAIDKEPIKGNQSTKSGVDDKSDTTFNSQIEQQENLFEHTLARADFEKRLQSARVEYSKKERELKNLYLHTCERNENEIRELVVEKEALQETLNDIKNEQILSTGTRIKELETQIIQLEKIRTRTEMDAQAKIENVRNEYSRAITSKEEHWNKKYCQLQNEVNDLRENLASQSMELDMSRTMIPEMESRILMAEEEKDRWSNRFHQITIKEENTKSAYEEKLKKVMNENQSLIAEIETFESFKEESTLLTGKLSYSIQEKQKMVVAIQSVVSKLETQNKNLTKEIDGKNTDVDQLVEEKLLLEDKLAQIWKNHKKEKDDDSNVHEYLLEKLENGEYFTLADIEKKESTIELLSTKLEHIKEVSNGDLLKSTKRSVNLHLQLRGVGLKLLETEESNIKFKREKEMSRKKIHELEYNLNAVNNSSRSANTHHQESIAALLSTLETKKTELLFHHGRLEEVQSLNGRLEKKLLELKENNDTILRNAKQNKLELETATEEFRKEKDCLTLKCNNFEIDAKASREIIKKLTDQIKSLTYEVNSGKAEHSDHILHLETEFQSVTNSNELKQKNLRFRNIELEKEIEEVRLNNVESQVQKDRLAKSLSDRESDLAMISTNLSFEINSHKAEQEEKQRRLRDTLQQVSFLENGLESAMKNNKSLSSTIKSYEEERAQLKLTLEEFEKKLYLLDKQIASLEKDLETAESNRNRFSNEVKSHQAEKVQLKLCVDDLEKKLELANTNGKSLLSEIAIFKEENTQLNSLFEENEEKRHILNIRIATVEKDLEAADSNRTALSSVISSSEIEKKSWESKIQEYSTENDILSSRTNCYETENKILKLNVEENSAENERLIGHVEYLERTVETADSNNKRISSTIKSNEIDTIQLKSSLKENEIKQDCLVKRIGALEKDAETSNSHQKVLGIKVDEYSTENERLVQFVGDLEKNLESSNANNKILSLKVNSVTTENESLIEHVSTLEKDLKLADANFKTQVIALSLSKEETEAMLQSQYEELSCTEMRLQILEEDYNNLQLSHEKLQGVKESSIRMKENLEIRHQETMQKFDYDLQSNQAILEATKGDLQISIDNLMLKNKESGVVYRDTIKDLTTKLELKKSECTATQARLKSVEKEWQEKINLLTNELEFTTKNLLQKQSKINDLEEVIVSRQRSVQEIHENKTCGIEKTVASQLNLINCCEKEVFKVNEENSTLKLTILDLENRMRDSSSVISVLSTEKEKLEETANTHRETHRNEKVSMNHSMQRLKREACVAQINLRKLLNDLDDKQKECDDLNASLVKIELSKENLSIDYCSEIFRLVKRLAIFEATHAEFIQQRRIVLLKASTQCVSQKQVKPKIRNLKKLSHLSVDQADQLRNQLKHNLDQQHQEEKLIAVELTEKTKQLEFLNLMTKSLQAEISSMLFVVKDLEDSKEKQFNGFKRIIADLQKELSSEKNANSRASADVLDVRMDLKMLDNRYTSMLQMKDNALCKSENSRTLLTSSLFQANAVLTTLQVQLKRKDCVIEEVMDDLRQSKITTDHKVKDLIESERLRFDLVETIKAQSMEIKCLLDQNSSSKDEILSVDEMLVKLKGDIELSDQKSFDLQSELEDKTKSVADLTKDLKIARCDYDGSLARKKTEYKERTRLLKNIECLSTKLISMEESQKISSEFEESLKKIVLKLRGSCVSKHLEANALEKEVVIIRHSYDKAKRSITELKDTVHALKVQEKDNCIILRNTEKELTLITSQYDSLKKENYSLEVTKQQLELLLSTKNNKQTQLNQTVSDLKNCIEASQNDRDLAQKDKTEITLFCNKLEREKHCLVATTKELKSSLLAKNNELAQQNEVISDLKNRIETTEKNHETDQITMLEKENSAITATIHEKDVLLSQATEKLSNAVDELTALQINLEKVVCDNAEDMRKTMNELEKGNRTQSMLQDEIQCLRANCAERESNEIRLNAKISILREDLIRNEEAKVEREKQSNKCNDKPKMTLYSSTFDDDMSDQLKSLKNAFRRQKDDAELSETMLENLMCEGIELSTQAETEILELSSSIGTMDDLLIGPSRIISALDLAGLGSSESYLNEIRSSLEYMASLAYTTGLELKNRKDQLSHWRSNRAVEPPTSPCTTMVKQVQIDAELVKSSEMRNKVAGARLLCCALESRTRINLASAFRKWSSMTYLMAANSSHRQTAAQLASQLEITREKLLVLKSNMRGQRKPKLRRILERIEI